MSASGYEDGLGRRTLEFDRETGAMLERLHLRPELRAFEAFLRERVAWAETFDDERFARARGIERDCRNVLTVLSRFVPGHRLCDLLEAATNLPADEATSPSVDAALGFLLEILPALGSLHTLSGHAHGTLGPGRIVLTQEGHVIVLEPVFGQPIERLQFNRARLWLELGLAAPPGAGPVRLDKSADIAQASLVAMMIVIGRPLRHNEYPDGIATLLTEVIEIAQIRGGSAFASGLQGFLARTLPLSTQHPYASAEEAATDVRHVAKEIGAARCRAALTSFVGDMNRVLPDVREYTRSPVNSFDEADAPGTSVEANVTVGMEDLSIDDLLAQMPASTEAFIEAERAAAFSSLDRDTSDAPVDPPAFDSTNGDTHHSGSMKDAVPSFSADTFVNQPAIEATQSAFVESIEPEPVPVVDMPPPVPVPVEEIYAPAPVAVQVVPEPEPTREPEPLPVVARAPEPEPAPALPPAPARVTEPVAASAPPPPTRVVPEPELEPVHEAPVAARRQEPPARPSKRKRRGNKPHRDKLRSNAVPKPVQPPPVVPMPVPLGAAPPPPPPAPPFGRVGEPLRQEVPTPIQFAPVPAVRPPAPPKPSAPLRLKTEGPSGFNPASQRAERREPQDVTAIPYVQRPEPESEGGFPWRLAAAAVVLIIVGVGAGKSYLSGRSKEDPERAAATAAPAVPSKAVDPSNVGTLALTTQPAGARVLIDGKAVGESPVTLTDLAPGKHALTILGSSGSVKKVVRIEAGKTLSMEVPIYSGWIAVFAPVPLDIAENGRAIGTTDQGRLMLSPGLHQLTLSNRPLGYKTVQIVDIEPGEERSINVQPTGALNANAEPWAEVWMAGKKVGETPIAGLQVPLGTHEILFKNPQFPEQRVTVTVTGTGTAIAAVDFTK
jgi:hypothetical protein